MNNQGKNEEDSKTLDLGIIKITSLPISSCGGCGAGCNQINVAE